MTPAQLAKSNTEAAHQTAFMCWCVQHPDPRLNFAFHIPNGGSRNKIEASRLKAQGVKAGVPDVFVPIPCGQYAGLWLEFKKPGTEGRADGGMSKDQVKWRDFLTSQHYFHFVVYSHLQASEITLNYLSLT